MSLLKLGDVEFYQIMVSVKCLSEFFPFGFIMVMICKQLPSEIFLHSWDKDTLVIMYV